MIKVCVFLHLYILRVCVCVCVCISLFCVHQSSTRGFSRLDLSQSESLTLVAFFFFYAVVNRFDQFNRENQLSVDWNTNNRTYRGSFKHYMLLNSIQEMLFVPRGQLKAHGVVVRRLHMVNDFPFESWSSWCIKGKKKGDSCVHLQHTLTNHLLRGFIVSNFH